MSGVRRSLAASFVGQYVTVFIQFLSSLILARILTPKEVGVYSVAVVLVGFAHVFRDFGVTNYLIQERDLTPNKIRTAIGVTLMLSWSLAAVLLVLSPFAGGFYSEPDLGQVVAVLAMNFLLIPFSSPAIACLRRDMHFDRVATVSIASAATGATASIVLALFGVGVISLAWGALTQAITTFALAQAFRPRHAPRWPRFKKLRSVLSFGGKATAAGMLAEAGLGATDLIAGRVLGFAAVGFYSKAWGTASLFNLLVSNAAGPVLQSALALGHRSGHSTKDAYLKALDLAVPLAWTFYGYAAFMAEPLVHLLFGSQWGQTVPILQILCVAFLLQALTLFSGQALLAMGQVDKFLRLQLIVQPARVLATLLAGQISIQAIAWVQVGFYLCTLLVLHSLLFRPIGITARDIGRIIHTASVLSGPALLPASLGWIALSHAWAPPLAILFTTAALTAGSFFFMIRRTQHPLANEISRAYRALAPRRP